MDRFAASLDFKVMALGFRIRDVLRPRIDILREVGIGTGAHVLDYGCGPGGYIPALAKLVGPTGRVYALDVNPAAIAATRRLAQRKRIGNVRTILSDRDTGLPAESVDVILLYDTFHHLSRPSDVLRELHRVLKADGVLSFSDHHMKEEDIIAGVTGPGMFELVQKGRRTYSLARVGTR